MQTLDVRLGTNGFLINKCPHGRRPFVGSGTCEECPSFVKLNENGWNKSSVVCDYPHDYTKEK